MLQRRYVRQEYCADFELVARRYLDVVHHRIFRWHFLEQAEVPAIAHALGMERGQGFHAVYRIEEHLGRILAELLPYPLFPVREYSAAYQHTAVQPFTRVFDGVPNPRPPEALARRANA